MAWKGALESKTRSRRAMQLVSEYSSALSGLMRQSLVAAFVLAVLLGASRAGETGRQLVSLAKGVVETDLSYAQFAAWMKDVPAALRKVLAVDISGFWTRAVTGKPQELVWPVWGQVTSYFGWRPDPVTQVMSLHQGIDIDAPRGSAVVSVLDGVVVSVRESPTYGLVVEIDHGNGLTSLYGHLDSASVVKDQRVKKGQTVGTVGQTGNAVAPHLHFELRKDGMEIDPMTILPPLVKGP